MSLKASMSESKAANGITKLNGLNYASWRQQMKMVLMKKEMWTVTTQGINKAAEEIQIEMKEVKTDEEKKAQQEKAAAKASKLSMKAFAEIGLSLDENVQNRVVGLKEDAKELWSHLNKLYAENTGVNQLQVKQQMMRLKKQAEDDMSTHVGKLQQLANQLKQMDAKAEESEVNLIMYLLNSLGTEWETWVSSIMTNVDKLSFDDVANKLLLEEARRKTKEKQDVEQAQAATRQWKPQARQWRPQVRTCFVCGSDRHLIADCTDPRKGQQRRPMRCFVCGGPHPAFKCSKRPRQEQEQESANEALENETCNVTVANKQGTSA